jgi:type II secretory pathway component PulF
MALEIRPTQDEPQKAGSARLAAIRWNADLRLFSRALGVKERMVFTEQLALLLDTGVSIHEALKALKQQSEDPRLAAILESLAQTVTEGKPFSAALSRHPEMFSQTYVSLVAAAEEGGFLQRVLQQLLEMDEKSSRMRATVVSALSYPVFLMVFSLAVVVFVLVVVFPKFQDLFESIKDQLPGTTLALMWISEFLRTHWLLTFIMLGAGVAGLLTWINSPAGARLLDELKMRTPVIRDIFVQVYLNQTLNVIGLALVSGVPITVALKASQDVVGNFVFTKFLETVRQSVNNGQGVAASFNQAAFIPPMVREMISTGERSGDLGKVMMRVADFYARELNRRIAVLAKVMEPFMLMVMGVVVGLLVASLILPIFKLSRAIR